MNVPSWASVSSQRQNVPVSRQRTLSVLFRHADHVPDLNDDLGQRQPAFLLGHDSLLHGEAKRVYVRKESFVFLRDETFGWAGYRYWSFHERLG